MSNKFYLGVAAVCIGLSFATLTQSKFANARTAALLMGATVSGIALSQCKNTQSRWEQRISCSWEEIESVKQKQAEAEFALQQQIEVYLASVTAHHAEIEREREMLRAEAALLENHQAQIEAEMAKLNRRESEFERVKQEAIARLDLYKQQILQDARSQSSIEMEQMRRTYDRAIEDYNRQLHKVQQEAELWKQRYRDRVQIDNATGVSCLSEYEQLLIELARETPGEWLYLNVVRNKGLFKRNKVKQSELENSIVRLSNRGLVEADTATRPPRYRISVKVQNS